VVEGQVKIDPPFKRDVDLRNWVVGLGRLIGRPEGSSVHQYSVIAVTSVKAKCTSYDLLDRLHDTDPQNYFHRCSQLTKIALNQMYAVACGVNVTANCIQAPPPSKQTQSNNAIAENLGIKPDVLKAVSVTYSRDAGDCIVNCGSPARVAIVIIEGKVSALSPDGTLLKHLLSGDYLGFENLLGSIYPWQVSLFAAVPTIVSVIDTESIKNFSKTSPAAAGKLLHTFCTLAAKALGYPLLSPTPISRVPLSLLGSQLPPLQPAPEFEVIKRPTASHQITGPQDLKPLPKAQTLEEAAVILESQQLEHTLEKSKR
jgi:hypothetical protein